MSSGILPAEFRCFRHIRHFYARNLPLRVAGAAEVDVDKDDIDPLQSVTTTSHGMTRRGCHTAREKHCVSSYFVLSLSPNCIGSTEAGDARRFYTSEVRRDTQHPVWDSIPGDIMRQYGGITQFVFSLYYCTAHPEEAIPAPDADFLLYEMLVQTTHVQFLAASVTKADALPILTSHTDNGPNSFVLLLCCVDGVFFPMHQGMHGDDGEVASSVINTPFLHEGIDISQPETDTDTIHSCGRSFLAGVEKMTVGDFKTCATATLAWHYLVEVATARREELQIRIDNMMESWNEEAAVVAQRAMLEARLSKTREQLQRKMQELHELREYYMAKHQRMMLQQVHRSELESISHMKESDEEINRKLNEQELSFMTLYAQVDGVRRLRMEELQALFPISVGENGVSDTICGHKLPGMENELGVTTETMHGWALALGAAAHLVTTVATVYGCTLPHPILLCGARCVLMARPGLPLLAVVAPTTGMNDVKFPLYCTRAVDQPLMTAAVELLLEDIAVLAKVMGRQNIAADAARGDRRLGAILKQLISFA